MSGSREIAEQRFVVRAHTAQLRVVTRLPIARAGCKCSSLAPVHGGRDWTLGRRGRAVLNRHVEVAGLDPSNCHTPPPSRSMPAARRYALPRGNRLKEVGFERRQGAWECVVGLE